MTLDEFIDRFHIRLNDQQLAAVRSINNPTLLLAVPGSGKTTVLVTRLGYMIYCCGISPERILTVTYTVAATRDMKQRFAALFGSELSSRLEFRTLNGICAKIIGYYGKCIGKKAYDLVTDEGYKMKLLSAIYVRLCGEYPTESDLKNLGMQITYIKNRMLSGKEIEKLGEEQDLPLSEIYTEYCNTMRQQSQMDYDDQMVYALTMLKKSPETLDHFQDIYQYLCVDEAQDTSRIQHEIIKILAGRYENLFMVGDEDQSIYGFRAAYPEALLEFEQQHVNAQILLMEENFRSNAKIVTAADRFIQKNEFRHSKRMKAAREAGTEIENIQVKTRREQYSCLAAAARACEEQTAVLYRDNESILPVVDLLEREGIPYRIKNADLSFFSHRIVMDIQNIIRFAANPTDTELFLQIYYKMGTYLNKMAALEACRNSERRKIPVLDAALLSGKLPQGTQKSVQTIQMHLQQLLVEQAGRAIRRIIDSMGYQDYLERVHMKDTKLPILEAIAEKEPSALRLVERLEELSELIREKTYDTNCRLILSTIHSSKGLEYDSVYLMDVKDGIFPEKVLVNRKTASMEERKLYEEERRLFYVGVTRARENLHIFTFPGGAAFSRELLGQEQQGTQLKQRGGSKSLQTGTSPRKKRMVTEAEYYDKLEEIRTTGSVRHQMYGEGRVLSVRGDTIEIQFSNKMAKCRLKYMMEYQLIQ